MKTPRSLTSWNPDAKTVLWSFDDLLPSASTTVFVSPELLKPTPRGPSAVLAPAESSPRPAAPKATRFNQNETQALVVELRRTERRTTSFRVLATVGVTTAFALALAGPSMSKAIRAVPQPSAETTIVPQEAPSQPAVADPIIAAAPMKPILPKTVGLTRKNSPVVQRTARTEIIAGRVWSP